MRFIGKKVVVTGACGVFGRWIAAAFAREGAALCLSDRLADALGPTRDALGLPEDTLLHATELLEPASIAGLAALVEERWGAPDIVVNNAGVYPAAACSSWRWRSGTASSASICAPPSC